MTRWGGPFTSNNGCEAGLWEFVFGAQTKALAQHNARNAPPRLTLLVKVWKEGLLLPEATINSAPAKGIFIFSTGLRLFPPPDYHRPGPGTKSQIPPLSIDSPVLSWTTGNFESIFFSSGNLFFARPLPHHSRESIADFFLLPHHHHCISRSKPGLDLEISAKPTSQSWLPTRDSRTSPRVCFEFFLFYFIVLRIGIVLRTTKHDDANCDPPPNCAVPPHHTVLTKTMMTDNYLCALQDRSSLTTMRPLTPSTR